MLCLLDVSGVASQARADDATRATGNQIVRSHEGSPGPSIRAAEAAQLERLYQARGSAPIWFGHDGDTRRARRALAELEAATEHGLAPADYDVAALGALLAAIESGERPVAAITRADRALSAAMLRYLSDLHQGRVPPSKAGFRYPAPRSFDPVALLARALEQDGVARAVANAEPSFPLYRRLRDALRRYRSIAATADAPAFAAIGRKELGARYPDAARLRRHLLLLGDMPEADAASAEPVYDALLSAAVSRFQDRHGLTPDGVLGKQTLAELMVPLAQRVLQIELAMERLRWLPDMNGRPALAINVPSYRLWAFADAGQPAQPDLTMRVIVGRAVTSMQTPLFIGEMRYLEINPFWNVPPSILRNEILPRLGRDPGYLQREDMEIVAGTTPVGSGVDAATLKGLAGGSLRVRQRPGPKNVLDGIKFVLPNTMNIYLHGTSARQLFARTRRDFSHGCIRLEDPLALALFVLRDQPTWSRPRIEAAIAGGTTSRVDLSQPVPVVIFYTTAIATRTGSVMFLPDVYGYDRKLVAALRAADRNLGSR